MTQDKLLITGADSYIGHKLLQEKSLQKSFTWIELKREMGKEEISSYLDGAKYLIHLFEARTGSKDQLADANVAYTEQLIDLMNESSQILPFIYVSSDYDDSDYGQSKLHAELLIREHGQHHRVRNMIYRLPILMGEQLYLDLANPLHDLCRQLIFEQKEIILPDQKEHKFVDINDVVQELMRALCGRAFYATVDLSICVIPSEHFASWDRVLTVLREIKERGEDYPLPEYRTNSLEYKLYRTYHSLVEYYSTSGIK